MYGSARLRAFYGQGDYSRATGMVRGYYSAGGFLKKLKKAARGVVKLAGSQLGRTALGFVPGGGILGGAAGLIKSYTAGKAPPLLASHAPSFAGAFGTAVSVAQALPGNRSGTPTNLLGTVAKRMGMPFASQQMIGAKTPNLALAGLVENPRKKRRKKRTSSRSSSRRRTSSRRRRGSSYRRGDYGDDWSGNRPSRAKHSGQFLTRAGGRRRKRRGARRGRGRVSFTTKDGRRVSFTPRKKRRHRRPPRGYHTLGGYDRYGDD